MRRMYSEQELTKIIGEVFDAKIEAGAFDDSISDAVDAYLAEHPVDITALEGKTIAPAVVNATTSISAPAIVASTSIKGMEKIIDSSDHSRFIEGDITTGTISGVTFTYAKWSLSGTHLMMVLAGTIESGKHLYDYEFGKVNLPSWVLSKIYPTVGSLIERKSFDLYKANESTDVTQAVYLGKSTNYLAIGGSGATQVTTTAEDSFRFQFDLLIDAD